MNAQHKGNQWEIQQFTTSSYVSKKRRVWLDTLIFSKLYRPLPFFLKDNMVTLSWHNRNSSIIQDGCHIIINGITITRNGTLSRWILVGKDYKQLPKKYKNRCFILDISLLRKLVSYYYRKELGINKILHT